MNRIVPSLVKKGVAFLMQLFFFVPPILLTLYVSYITNVSKGRNFPFVFFLRKADRKEGRMTIEEAITQLKMDRDLCSFNPMTGEEEPMNEDCRKSAEALNMAIKALEEELCEDCISRQALIERIDNAEENFKVDNMDSISIGEENPFVDGVLSGVFNIRLMIAQAPPVTPTRKKGKWIPRKAKYDNAVPVYECSICHKNNGFDDDNFCPNCGAEMESEE